MTTPFEPPLQVDPRHLLDLAGQHEDIADQIGQATSLTDGDTADVMRSHGSVCHPVWSRLAETEAARKEACTAMRALSDRYASNLLDAAQRYRHTDGDAAGAISDAGPH